MDLKACQCEQGDELLDVVPVLTMMATLVLPYGECECLQIRVVWSWIDQGRPSQEKEENNDRALM